MSTSQEALKRMEVRPQRACHARSAGLQGGRPVRVTHFLLRTSDGSDGITPQHMRSSGMIHNDMASSLEMYNHCNASKRGMSSELQAVG